MSADVYVVEYREVDSPAWQIWASYSYEGLAACVAELRSVDDWGRLHVEETRVRKETLG